MARIAILYAASLVVFLAVDAVMLGTVMTPLFRENIGHLMASPMRLGPAAVFYLFYVAALLYLVSAPALKAGKPGQTIVPAAVLGLASYGTFEFTNYAILADWALQMVVTDTIWGGVLTAITAWSGVAITMRVRQA
jgi:uncharacterized membrane protein